MKRQDGKSPLGWIITVVISLLVVGVIIAMLFVGNDDFFDMIEQYKNNNAINTLEIKP